VRWAWLPPAAADYACQTKRLLAVSDDDRRQVASDDVAGAAR
jgi:hypothetical protein